MKGLDEIRIGIIGVGLLGNLHNQAIQTIIEEPYLDDDVTVSVDAICDTRGDYVKEYADSWKIPFYFTDYHRLLELDTINAVYIATPTVSHKEIFLAAAKAGKHIFIQKPLAFFPNDIGQMIKARDENGIHVQVGHVLRQDPGFWTVRSMIHNSELREKMGKLFNIHFLSDQEKPYTGSGFHPSTWRKDKNQAHAGTLYEHSIHDFDVIHYWFGDQYRFSRVTAQTKNFFALDGIEDSVGVLADLENISGELGATFVLTAVWHNIHRDERHIEIFWENAHLDVRHTSLRMSGFLEIEGGKVVELNQEQMDQEYREAIGHGFRRR